ncbi:glutaminase [Morganella morganii]|nr:glutaminase [Morganella morganii]
MPCFGVTTLTTHFSNELLDDILHRVRPLIGSGKVADYIPALAEVSPDWLGDRGVYRGRGDFCRR